MMNNYNNNLKTVSQKRMSEAEKLGFSFLFGLRMKMPFALRSKTSFCVQNRVSVVAFFFSFFVGKCWSCRAHQCSLLCSSIFIVNLMRIRRTCVLAQKVKRTEWTTVNQVENNNLTRFKLFNGVSNKKRWRKMQMTKGACILPAHTHTHTIHICTLVQFNQ